VKRFTHILVASLPRLLATLVLIIVLPYVSNAQLTSSTAYHQPQAGLYKPSRGWSLWHLARTKFGSLSPAEEKLLEAYQNQEAVVCSPDSLAADPCKTASLNPDPITFEARYHRKPFSNSEKWGSKTTIRASLIRWLSTDDDLEKTFAPAGIVVVGARILGSLNLQSAQIPFPLTLLNCEIPQPIILTAAELTELNLDGTQTSGVFADYVRVRGGVFMRWQFVASGPVRLIGAQVGFLDLSHHSQIRELVAYLIKVHGGLLMTDGFQAAREVFVSGAEIDGNLDLTGGEFHSGTDGTVEPVPDEQTAIMADLVKVHGTIVVRRSIIQGYLRLLDATIDGDLFVACSQFLDTLEGGIHVSGLQAQGAVISRRFSWEGMNLSNNTEFDVTAARTASLNDDVASWPQPGKLRLDGFTYGGFEFVQPSQIKGCPKPFSGTPLAYDRLEWLQKYREAGFRPQPYEQLATVLRLHGDEAAARQVMIAMESARYKQLGFPDRLWGFVLWVTIGYGYDTWRVLWFIVGFVGLGTIIFNSGHRKGAIVPIDRDKSEHTKPFNPFVFSLEAFLPLVDLNQAKYWSPDPDRYRRKFDSGFAQYVRCYLWVHNVAGWFFTSMLVAGITGLARS
jgi:hypothetical protein